jgi:hypothetical protein
MTALQDLTALVSNLPNAALLTDGMKQSALNGALIPDSFNVWPGQPGYENTYDIYFAAVGLVGFLQAQPVVRQSSSEGTSVAVDAPNWGGLIAWYRSMSPIAQATSGSSLGIINIPGGPHVVPTDMNSRIEGYDNVDTDLN